MARDSEKNTIKPTKGFLKGYRWIIFDAIGKCTGENCPLYDMCPYEKNGVCSVEAKYTTAIFDSFVEQLGDKLNQSLLNAISLRLVPLFGQLVRMKKVALGIKEPTYETVQGAKKIHPVFREMREIIRGIESTQRSMGLDGEYMEALKESRGMGSSMERLPSNEGDVDYVAEMMRGEEEVRKRELFPEGIATHPKRAVKGELIR